MLYPAELRTRAANRGAFHDLPVEVYSPGDSFEASDTESNPWGALTMPAKGKPAKPYDDFP